MLYRRPLVFFLSHGTFSFLNISEVLNPFMYKTKALYPNEEAETIGVALLNLTHFIIKCIVSILLLQLMQVSVRDPCVHVHVLVCVCACCVSLNYKLWMI